MSRRAVTLKGVNVKILQNKRTALVVVTMVAAAGGAVGYSWAGDTDNPTVAAECEYPSEVLDLTPWKLTLPIGDDEDPTEITQPELDGFVEDPLFVSTEDCDGVQFRAPVNGVTTGGSEYPRSELREMTADGSDEASWSSTDGTHTMVSEQAFTALPEDTPNLVAGQIHDGDDDVTVFRLEGSELWITDGDTSHGTLVTDDYELGTKFEAKFVVSDGQTEVYYNDELQTTYDEDYEGAYFKVGAYTQTNCEDSSPCEDSNFGEVVVYSVDVTHE